MECVFLTKAKVKEYLLFKSAISIHGILMEKKIYKHRFKGENLSS